MEPFTGQLDQDTELKPFTGALDQESELQPFTGPLDQDVPLQPFTGKLDQEGDTSPIGDQPPDFGNGGGPLVLDAEPNDPKRKVGTAEAFGRGAVSRAAQLAATGNKVMALPAVLWDKALGTDALENLAYGTMVDPATKLAKDAAIDPNTERLDAFGKLSSAAGSMTPDLLSILATGGATAPEVAAPAIGSRIAQGVAAMTAPAAASADQVYQQGIDAGLTPAEAAKRAAVTAGTTLAMGAVPMALPGNAATRIASGAIGGGLFGEASRQAVNAVTPDSHPELKEEYDPTNVLINAALGGAMGGALGHRAETIGETSRRLATELRDKNPVEQGQKIAESILGDTKSAKIDDSILLAKTDTSILPKMSPMETPPVESAAPELSGLISTRRNANSEFIHVADQGAGVTHQVSHSPLGVFSRTDTENGHTSHSVLNQEGNFVNPTEINRNTGSVRLPEETAWSGSPEARQFVAEQHAKTQLLSDENYAKRSQIIKDLVTNKIDLAEAQNQAAALDSPKPELPKFQMQTPDESTRAAHDASINAVAAEHGLSPEATRALSEKLAKPAPRDHVTGFYDGRSATPGAEGPIESTIKSAQEDARAGQPATIVSWDLANLGGINKAKGSTESANPVVREIAQTVRTELESLGGKQAALRAGGDEFEHVMAGVSPEQVQAALPGIRAKIQAIAEREGLYDIPHAKEGRAPGIDVHFGVHDVHPDEQASNLRRTAAEKVEAAKESRDNEYRKQIETTRAGTPEGQADRTASGVSAPNRESGPIGRASESQVPEEALASSHGEPVEHGLSVPEAEAAHVKEWGQSSLSRLKRNGLEYTTTEDAVSRGLISPKDAETAKAFYDPATDKVRILSDKITPETLPGVVVHDVGWHKGVPKLLGPELFQDVLRAGERLVTRDPEVATARKMVPRETNAKDIPEETLGYLVEHFPANTLSKKIVDGVKLGLNRMGVPLSWIKAETAAIRKIAALGLKHAEEMPAREGVNALGAVSGPQPAKTPQPVETPTTGIEADQQRGSQSESAPLSVGRDGNIPQEGAAVEASPGRGEAVPAPTAAPEPKVSQAPDGNKTETQKVTSIKNAQVEQERLARDQPALESEGQQTYGQAWENAKATLAEHPDAGKVLTAEILMKPRAISQDEAAVLLHDRVQLHNDYDAALKGVTEAREAKNDSAEIQALERLKTVESQMDANDEASRQAGSESGRSLNARRMMANADYSLARVMQRARIARGESVPREVQARIEGLVKQAKEYQARIAELESAKPAPKGKRAPKQTLDDQFAELGRQLAKISRKPESQSSVKFAKIEDPETARILKAMAKNRVEAGETDPMTVVDQIHEAVSESGYTKGDIADTIDGSPGLRKATRTELQDKLVAFKSELRDLNKLSQALKGAEAKTNNRRQAAIQKSMAEIQRKIDTKDFSKPERVKPAYNEKTLELEAQLNRARQKLDRIILRQEARNQSWPKKVFDVIHNVHLAAILSSLHVYPKLAGAVVSRLAVTPLLEETSGLLLRQLPGIKQVAELAPRHGHGSLGAEVQAIRGIGKGLKGAWEQLRDGQSKLDALYGSKDKVTGEFTDFMGGLREAIQDKDYMEAVKVVTGIPGRTHAMVKELASQPEFYRSYYTRGKTMREALEKQGLSPDEVQEFMLRKSTEAELGAKAYTDALEAKMQGPNAFADSINRMIMGMEKSDNAGLHALAFAFKTVFPIRKIPVNIAKELSSYVAGGAKALYAARGGLKDMTEARAEYIMKNVKKQGAGLILFALGYLAGPSVFGGIPQKGDAKKKLAVKPEEGNIGGVELNAAMFHSPAAQMLQFGSGYRRVFESYYGKDKDAIDAGLHSLFDNAGVMAVRNIPYLDQPRRWMNTIQYGRGVEEIAGNQIRSMLIPQVVQQIAAAQDPYKGFRKPRNIVEDVKTGIPGLRETVPQPKPKRYATH